MTNKIHPWLLPACSLLQMHVLKHTSLWKCHFWYPIPRKVDTPIHLRLPPSSATTMNPLILATFPYMQIVSTKHHLKQFFDRLFNTEILVVTWFPTRQVHGNETSISIKKNYKKKPNLFSFILLKLDIFPLILFEVIVFGCLYKRKRFTLTDKYKLWAQSQEEDNVFQLQRNQEVYNLPLSKSHRNKHFLASGPSSGFSKLSSHWL